ncbi:hypothetical protein C2S53_008353 [Perilla frutescens var. hirtella]|uniref:Uncharacterized protein n=1 Tax=Perilla frutescens var. hirtella TaxID=608512 RepID=A0AAD4JDN8_PERFH|nr:hypothetical protein C2S53_008353 [Perilla frutescens var. hirtella]
MEIEEESPKHVTLDIVNEDALLSSIKEKMEHISLSHCVCRVPEKLYKVNEEKYYPYLVSIGPFHHGKNTLKLMEDQKWRYLNALLSRKPNAEATLDTCIRALRQVEQKARKFYGEPIQMGSDRLVELLLLDGCFIIELFLHHAIKNLRRRDDPCFSSDDSLFHLRCDLIMYENQLPFFILDQIFHIVPIPKHCHLSLIDLALDFFKKLIPDQSHQNLREIFSPQTHHLLDLIRQHYLPTSSAEIITLPNVGCTNMPHASRLLSLGISVERATSSSPTNIQFFNGKLKIPSLEIHAYTEILFRNLIAMEHCSPGCSKHVTSYVFLMERLIRSPWDVRLLQEREVLIDGHEREKEIAFLLQKLHVDINPDDFYYGGLCEQVRHHQTRRRDVWWERVRDVYHGTRFGLAGFSLALLLLVFLFTGAFFSAVYFLLHHFQ